jgi:TonB-dependent receptor
MNSRILIFFFTLISITTWAQKGTINGTLRDKEMNDEPLPFANVLIKGTSLGTTTDENGKYSLSVPAGSHILVFGFLGYENLEVPVTIEANETIVINRSLSAGGGLMLTDVVVETVRRKNTEAAIMLEVKEAKQVVSAISAEQMQKGTDSNAAQAVQRVPGVTIVEGRFVMIRGLSERYNNVLINNAVAPSTEIDKRTFSFDMIPTGLLDKIVIYKTGSADLPGDFSGGIIKLTTSENIEDFTKVGVSFGYRNNTSLNPYFQSRGSSTDVFGFDNSFRPLPSNFPNSFDINTNPQISVDAANSLPNNFNPTEGTAFLDTGVGFSMGRNIALNKNRRLMTINSLSYSNSYQNYERNFNRYFALQPGDSRPQDWFRFVDSHYENEVRMTLLSNWSYRWNSNNIVKFKNLFNQIGENNTILRRGRDFQQQLGNDMQNYLLGYKSRSIYSGQVEGEHKVGNKNQVDWVAGVNYVAESEPDLRRFRTIRSIGAPAGTPFEMIDPASSNLFDTGRFYGELSEISFNHGANYTHVIERVKGDEEFADIKLKAGYYLDYRSRDFDSRYVSYFLSGNAVPDSERRTELKQLPLSEIFSPANVSLQNGWWLREGTRPADSYSATNTLTAGYLMGEFPYGKFDITGGVRVEHNVLELSRPSTVSYPLTSILPSLNVGYNINEKSIFRTAYSRTVNRPEFREIAPFLFYNYELDANFVGAFDVNTGVLALETATIDNLDIRYEFYPEKGETISIGAFYKNFSKPIEFVTQLTTENPLFLFANAERAYNYGLEFETRLSLSRITTDPIISRMSANINASYIVSQVDLGTQAVAQDRKRPLQGQSPYIINAALSYDDKENNFGVSLIYNRFGDRIFVVGDVIFPTIYERSRDHIDVTISKTIKKTTFKLGIQDLLNAPYRFWEDTNRDEKISKSDNPIINFRRGTMFNCSITYNL